MKKEKSDSISAFKCRKKLAILWFIGAGILFVLLMVQTFSGKYEIIITGEEPQNKTEEAWSWFLPTVMPTLALMMGTFFSNLKKKDEGIMIEIFKYRFARNLSIFYLLSVASTFFLCPFFSKSQLELMKLSNFGIAPLQGLVCAIIGAFFLSQKAKQAGKSKKLKNSEKKTKSPQKKKKQVK